MNKLFEKNTVMQVVIILATLALLWVRPMFSPEPMPAPDGYAPLYSLIYNLSMPPVVAMVAAMVLVVLGGVMLNLLLAKTGLVPQNTLLPTLLYIVFMGAGSHTLTPMLFVSLLSIVCAHLLTLRSMALTISLDKICGVGALLALCSMFYLPSLLLLVAYLLVVVSYRLYSWREWAACLLGLLAPYLLLWIILFLKGGLRQSLMQTAMGLAEPAIEVQDVPTLAAVANALLVVVLLVSVVYIVSRLGESTVVWKKNAVIFIFPLLSALVMVPYSRLFPVDMQPMALAFAFCGTQMLLSTSRNRRRRRRDWRPGLHAATLMFIIIAAALC